MSNELGRFRAAWVALALVTVGLGGSIARADGPAAAVQPGEHKYYDNTMVGGKKSRRPYVMYVPPTNDLANADGKLPMIVFLHGIVEGGDDGNAMFKEAIPAYVHRPDGDFLKAHPFIYLIPQNPNNVNFDSASDNVWIGELIDQICQTYPVDRSRIYLTGLSMGGRGTWELATEYPTVFAAICPVSSREPIEPDDTAAALVKNNVAVRLTCGGGDGDFLPFSKAMIDALTTAGQAPEYKEVPGVGHGDWDPFYKDNDLYAFFLKHKRDTVDPNAFTTSASTRPAVVDAATAKLKTDKEGFIRDWLVLDPIAITNISDHTEAEEKPVFDKEYWTGEKTANPTDGLAETVDGKNLAWHARHAADFGLNFVDICAETEISSDNSLFLGVTYVWCDQAIPQVTLATGSDDSCVWFVNGQECNRVYKSRGVNKDDDKSPPMDLKQGLNVVMFEVSNGDGGSGACARFLGQDGKPVMNYTVILNPALMGGGAASNPAP